MSPSIDFAWYLDIWLFDLRLEERAFWKTMTPARFMALYKRRLGWTKTKPKQVNSLSEYLMGGA